GLRRSLRQVLHLKAVVVVAPLAACQDLLGNLLDRETRVPLRLGSEGRAEDEQRTLGAYLFVELLKLVVSEVCRGDVDEVSLRRTAVLPVNRVARRILKPLKLADRFREHAAVVLLVDDPVAPAVLLEKRRSKAEVSEASTSLPVDSLCDTTRVFAID